MLLTAVASTTMVGSISYSLMCVFESSPLTELPRGSLYMWCHSSSASGTGLFLASETAVSTSFFTAYMHDKSQKAVELFDSMAESKRLSKLPRHLGGAMQV